jgi:phosphopantothenoylcysteine decarboxylase/phosphopantothenate--cysteine ligase
MIDPYTGIKGSRGNELAGKRIGLCITGSVAASNTPELARELIRHGAEVVSILSNGAQSLIQPELMRWATQNEPVTAITGRMEHIKLTEEESERLSLVLIAPATANTLSKIASGVSDTPVTLLASCAIGAGLPIIAAPSMHASLWANSVVQENLTRLRNMEVELLSPLLLEGKAKMASVADIVEAVIRRLTTKDLGGLRIMVTAGPTYEQIDPVRLITNRSSGKMGFALAQIALRRGADVTLISGPSALAPPPSAKIISVETTREMADTVAEQLKETKFDLFLAAAAPSDFRPVEPSPTKISSRIERPLDIKLEAAEKVIGRIKQLQPSIFLIAFKAEWNISRNEVAEHVKMLINESGADMVAVNNVAVKGTGFGADANQVLLVKKDGSVIDIPLAQKQVVAHRLLDAYLEVSRKAS